MTALPGRSVAEAVGAALSEAGVGQAFGVLGSGNFAVTRALIECGSGWVPARHEGGAIVMADVYARLTGMVAACSVHQGPGFTNCITGLTEAAKARTPLLVLAADTAEAARRSNFRIDQAGIAAAVGALHVRLASSATAVEDALRAHRLALTERRPVVLSLPLDIQAQPAPGLAFSAAPIATTAPQPAAAAIVAAADLLAAAQRPLLIAGRGASRGSTRALLERLGDAAGALFATSAAAHGLFSGNPWSVGISGGFASPTTTQLMGEADVVIALGATLNMWTTRRGRLLGRSVRVIQVDLDEDAIGSHRPVQLGLVGDLSAVAAAITSELESRGRSGASPGWRSPAVRARIAAGRWNEVPFEDTTDGRFIDPRTLSIRLDAMLPLERTLAIDSGHFMGWPAMYMRVPDVTGFVFTQAFQSIGLGLAGAIGAAVARPDRVTVAAVGDGGLLMGISELETAVRLGLRMLVVTYNDAAYGAEVHHFGPEGIPVDLHKFPATDIAAIGRGAGAKAATVRSAADLAPVQEWLDAGAGGVFVIDAKVDPTVVGEWLPDAFGH